MFTSMPHNPRIPVIALVLTLCGLLALLVTPLIAHQRSDRLHVEIEAGSDTRNKINEALAKANEIHVTFYQLYFYDHAAAGTPQALTREHYQALIRDWQGTTAEDQPILPGGPDAVERWRKGRSLLLQWFQTYGVYSDAYLPEKVAPSDALFKEGLTELLLARELTDRHQNQLRQEINAISGLQVDIMVPLALICLLLALLFWRNLLSLRHSWQREQETTARLEIAMQESNHRIKNNLQVVSSLLDMQIMEAEETIPKAALQDLVQQVKAVAAVHDFLSHELRSGTVQGDRMLQKLVELAAQPAGLKIQLEADAVGLEVKQATALALITNELLLNAGKHGATEAMVCIRSEGNTATLQVTDNGPGFPPSFDPDRDSNLGIALVSTLARHDLDGEVVFQTRDGAFIEITFPLQVHAENKEPLKK